MIDTNKYNTVVHNWLSTRLGENVLIEHVYPFTYICQPKRLLDDIRSFKHTIQFIEEKYTIDYRPITLFNDISYFMMNRFVDRHSEVSYPNYLRILHRFYKNKMFNDDTIYAIFLRMNYQLINDNEIIFRIRQFIGMMNTYERDYFVANYILQ